MLFCHLYIGIEQKQINSVLSIKLNFAVELWKQECVRSYSCSIMH